MTQNTMVRAAPSGLPEVMNGGFKLLLAATTAILLTGVVPIFADLTDGLVAYYPFNGNANDASGNGNHGVAYNQPAFVEGRIGQAIRLNGVDQYVEVAASSVRDFYANPFSVAFWFRTTEQDYGYMLDSRSADPHEQGYGLTIHTSGPGLVWGVQNDGQYYPGPQVGPHINSFQDGNWHMAVGVREPSGIALYLDGVLVERVSIPADLNVGAAKPLRIGTRFFVDDPSQYYTGDLEELRIYNRALSATEVAQLYSPRDYFLEALAEGSRLYFTPGGGAHPKLADNTTVSVDYWNMPKFVKAGQQVTSSIGYTIDGPGAPTAVTYKTVLAEWQPFSPLATLENGILQGVSTNFRHSFSFNAPTIPGTYRLRFAMVWAHQGITNFFGNGPAGDAWNPGAGDYAEVTLIVGTPPVTDYFLEALNTNAVQVYEVLPICPTNGSGF